MSPPSVHSLVMEKGDDTVKIEHSVDVTQDITAIPVDHRPEVLRRFTPDELLDLERKLVRRLDWRCLPILIFLFLLNILDRNAIANARLGGLEADLGMDDRQYQTAIMVLWAGYISMMIPSNMLLSVFKPRIYLPTVVIIWGIVSGASGFVQNYGGIVALRFLVGVTEAPYFPGVIFFLSCWYKRSELPFRIAIFYSGYTLSSAFGGLIAAGIIGNMDGVGGYASWRWLFILEGIATVIAALPAYYLLPNYPTTTSWLSEEERALAAYRLALEADGEDDDASGKGDIWRGLKQCFADPKVWLLVLIQSCATIGMSFTYFFPSIVQTLGYSRVLTLLLTAPPYFAAFLFSLLNSWHSARTGERGWHIICALLMGAVGQIMAMTIRNTGGRYFAMFLAACGAFSAFQVILSWVNSTIARPKAKRAVAVALATAVANCTNISTAYVYPKTDAPMYRTGGAVLCAFLALGALASLLLKVWLGRLNKRADERDRASGVGLGGDIVTFRYVL